MRHYTYLIQHNSENKRYIGVRSCDCDPVDDTEYWGSSKHLPSNMQETHTKIILKEHVSRKEAVAHEIGLHNLNDVAVNPIYYNQAKQTSTGFDTSGVPMRPEIVEKIKKATKGKPKTEEHNRKAKEGAKRARDNGYVVSLASRQKMSNAQKALAAQADYVNPRKGVTLSVETKEKLSKSIKATRAEKLLSDASPRFSPWFITDTVAQITHLFYKETKQEYALRMNCKNPATYRALAQRSKGIRPINRGPYKGLIVGNIPQ